MARMALVALTLLLAACGGKAPPEVVTEQVKVPIPTMPEVPDRLAAPYDAPELPRFLPADRPGVCLDQEGVDRFQDLIDSLDSRRRAWRTWWRKNGE